MILDWKLVSKKILADITEEISHISPDNPPTLAVILVGDNPASLAYIRMKQKRAEEVGMNFILKKFDTSITEASLKQEISILWADTSVSGIIVQMPLPKHINEVHIIETIPPEKDVDGFSKSQIGNMFLGSPGLYSCTPQGIMKLLEYYNIGLTGKKVTILGRSNIVGKPLSILMINAGATVTICNSKTQDIASHTRNSDIVVVAIGKEKFLTRDMVSENAIIIDVGSNRQENGTFCGDADYENLVSFVQSITPSPGWVGPMTVAMLISNTLTAYKIQNSLI